MARSPEKNREWQRQYYAANKDKLRGHQRKYRETTPGVAMTLYQSAKGRARARNMAFDLTKAFVQKLVQEAVDAGRVTTEYYSPMRASIDRVESDLGYLKSNVQIIPAWLNYAYNEWPKAVVDEAITKEARRLNVL